jgi:hypothetical protein
MKRLTIFISSATLRPAGIRRVICRHNPQVDNAIPTRATQVLRSLNRFSFRCESQVVGTPISAVFVDNFDFVAHR